MVPLVAPFARMANTEKLLEQMRREPANVRYGDLMKVCVVYFGQPRQGGTSHAIFKTPWPGEPSRQHPERYGQGKAVPSQAGPSGH